jgi:hypothetical protein
MTLCSAQVTSRSNSDLLTIERIAEDTSMDTPTRMTLIQAIVNGWDRATAGSTGRYAATSQAAKREPLTMKLGGLAN